LSGARELTAPRRGVAALWLASAFCSAFLLFLVQPMLAKWLLPSFGGTPGTWAACLLFFQCVLLGGYAYAWLLARLQPRAALLVHGVVCAGVIVFACSAPPLAAAEGVLSRPELRIPALLALRAGLPYALLASTAPLLTAWAAQLGAAVPHRLYAVSNAGSLLGLLGYPLWFEAAWPLPRQYAGWLAGSALFAGLSLACAFVAHRGASAPASCASRSSAGARAFWLLSAFVPSLFLLAATEHITVDLAATPALWVMPLSLYLISFIAAFSGWTARARGVLLAAWVVASLGLGYGAFVEGSARLGTQLVCALGGLFAAALLCHDALVQARPEPDGLPEFYLWVAAGGALGGIYVTWIAPLVLRDYYELELAVLLTYALLLWSRRRHGEEHAGRRRLLWFGSGVALPLLAAAMLTRAGLGGREKHVLDRRRSFLGALRVTQIDVGRMLTHGRIRHGMQLSDPARARWPTMYFGPGTAVAQVLTHHHQGRPRHLAVVGLGVGTLAAYGQPRDRLRFYELDPNVLAVAREWFTFLRDTPARVDVVLGDGRLALAREAPQRFDVLVLDAFASDAVPAHLLTYEAFSIYLRQLAPDGVLLANVSNRHLSVDRVVRAAARALGLACEVVETEADVTRFVSKVRWAVLARDPAQLRRELAGLTPAAPSGGDVLWTDARASVWSILK
jgi:hypothetical protein